MNPDLLPPLRPWHGRLDPRSASKPPSIWARAIRQSGARPVRARRTWRCSPPPSASGRRRLHQRTLNLVGAEICRQRLPSVRRPAPRHLGPARHRLVVEAKHALLCEADSSAAIAIHRALRAARRARRRPDPSRLFRGKLAGRRTAIVQRFLNRFRHPRRAACPGFRDAAVRRSEPAPRRFKNQIGPMTAAFDSLAVGRASAEPLSRRSARADARDAGQLVGPAACDPVPPAFDARIGEGCIDTMLGGMRLGSIPAEWMREDRCPPADVRHDGTPRAGRGGSPARGSVTLSTSSPMSASIRSTRDMRRCPHARDRAAAWAFSTPALPLAATASAKSTCCRSRSRTMLARPFW